MESSPTTRTHQALWWVRWVPHALLFLLFGFFMFEISGPVLVPLMASFALAFMLEPVVEWFQRQGHSRTISVLLTLGATLLTIVAVIAFLVPGILRQFNEWGQKAPVAFREAGVRVQHLIEVAETRVNPEVFASVREKIDAYKKDPSIVITPVTNWAKAGLASLLNIGSSVVSLLIAPFFAYYLLLDLKNIRRAVDEHIPIRHRGSGEKLFDEIGSVVRGYVQGRVLVVITMSIFYSLGLYLLDVPLWAVIGIIAGVIGVIPYLGLLSGLVLALAFAAMDGGGWGRIFGVVILFAVAHFIEDYVLVPRLIGDRLELHPMLLFITLIVAGQLFGLLGMVLAIPVLAVGKVMLRFFDELYLNSEFFLGHPILDATGANRQVEVATARTVSHEAQMEDVKLAKATREAASKRRPRRKNR